MALLPVRSKTRLAFSVAFLLWLVAFILLLNRRLAPSAAESDSHAAGQPPNSRFLAAEFINRVEQQQKELQQLLVESRQLAEALRAQSSIGGNKAGGIGEPTSPRPVMATLSPADSLPASIAVLVIACNRPTVRRSLDQIFKYMPTSGPHQFHVIVSQDCGHAETASVIQSYGNKLVHIRQPDLSPISVPAKERALVGYYYISRHFRWAFDQVFLTMNYTAAIVVEDDLDIAPDFFDYFIHLGRVMAQDPTVWCVSAWNDNGKSNLIDTARSDLFYRTDFFPGLGWMLLRPTWLELRTGWPAAYWDDHMRKAGVRRGRACLRPEVSRSYTFGRVGVSNGLYFDKYLRFIELSKRPVNYAAMDLSYLLKSNYDSYYLDRVYKLPSVTLDIALGVGSGAPAEVRVQYNGPKEFVAMAKRLDIMPDFKDGVARCAYSGVVPVFKSGRRIHLAPGRPWKGYDVTWK
ncbi:hypothetical protein BOX15_Mlig029797g1 [Macrostomum lignano]|uniref:Alpha-1,3-mannosyl-glycoprotein 2-beta-N-acetylglucosaminyltransferase n=1 Tax=Macrostomum lignano TaxID=282301 RepID=A0A267EK42_9PLAT|nr:hypothetical protein BOX15_Mlig029797g1 [Macrostomum lignano]